MLKRLDDIIIATKNGTEPYWFSSGAVTGFGMRVSEIVYSVLGGALFVTSECDDRSPRRYTVRACSDVGRIENVSVLGEYRSGSGAHARAKREAQAWTRKRWEQL